MPISTSYKKAVQQAIRPAHWTLKHLDPDLRHTIAMACNVSRLFSGVLLARRYQVLSAGEDTLFVSQSVWRAYLLY